MSKASHTPAPAVPVIAPVAAASVVVVAALAFWRPTLDVFNTTKVTIVLLGAVALVATLTVAGLRRGRLRVLWGPWPLAGLGLVGWMIVSTLASGEVWRGIFGAPGRHGGVALYAAAVILALVAATATDRSRRTAVSVLLAGLVPVAVYALLQSVGADPFPWATVEGGDPVFASFGNVDFASAWMGIVGVLAVGVAASPDRPGTWRRGAAVLALVTVVAAVVTGSLQGPVILLAGAAVVLLAVWRPGGRVLAAVGVVALVLATLTALGPGRSVVDGAARSFETRVPKWAAALSITADAPLTGRGPDSYEDWFFAARTPDVAAESGLRRSVDNAHNVALHLAAGAGVPAALAWLVFVIALPLTGLWRARRTITDDPERLALVVAWAGYLVQSAVSIDVPPLAGLGLLLTGFVVGTTGDQRIVRTREVTVGSWPVPLRWLAVVGVVLLGVAAAAVAVRPWRADALGWDAELARGRGDLIEATALTDRAADVAPWVAQLDAAQGAWLTGLGRLEEALVAQTEAHRRRPLDLSHALNRARLLAALGRTDEAREAYAVVAAIDPHTPAVTAEVEAAGPAPPPSPSTGSSIGPPPDGD